MKKRIVVFAMALVVGIGMASFTSYVSASATHEEGEGCNLLDGNGDSLFTTDSFVVRSNNRNNNTLLVCKAAAANDSGKALVIKGKDFDDETCFWPGAGATSNFMIIVSASGNATLTCHFKNAL